MKEIEIKKVLIEHLINCDNNIISSEFRFDFGTRRADIICMLDDMLIAYEIKGAGDNTERLATQIDSYRKYFDFCFIVCERSNVDSIRKKTPRSVGIIVIENEVVTQVRKSNKIKKHDKITLASTIDINYLRRLVVDKRVKSKHELCEALALQKSLDDIRKISREDVFKKIVIPYKLFLAEMGKIIHSDDILTLTRMPSLELV
ncbi:sce7726 family protein [Serratia sp. SRS-8-S-2018]|uniref:sce7726 family protein n=1 Tax=Serratia TaxID=613 RepID=UPI0009759086|nr:MULTISPECIES: sce7726 family protein [Serratia]EJC6393895.1 sce7726 family protein [Serratia marcescens]EJC6395667.1 sce7726 family protein [Serratia marcescens]OMP53579.1 protein cII [Serratia marcescens]RZF16547.1 protein cII [Serratia marcescens]TPW49163.1 sce7726 family protein [Serratia sp. SRS-8-S-2018]